jgi:aryl-alcohol dehydrogenase-like predicted oxidoreductase
MIFPFDMQSQPDYALVRQFDLDVDIPDDFDGRPQRIRVEVDESLARLGTDHLDLLYLHAPDPAVPVAAPAAPAPQAPLSQSFASR